MLCWGRVGRLAQFFGALVVAFAANGPETLREIVALLRGV